VVEMKLNTIYQGDALKVLQTFPAETISCVMTSPPYWGLRDYGDDVSVVWDGDSQCQHEFDVAEGENLLKEYVGGWERPSRKEFSKVGSYLKCIVCGKEFKGKLNQKFCSTTCLNTLSNEERHNLLPKQQFCSKCNAWKGQLGLEPDFNDYIRHLCDIFDEVKRVLRKDGTCWVNIGDTYSGMKSGNTNASTGDIGKPKYAGDFTMTFTKEKQINYPDKSLCLIPFRFAIEMVNRGWILRNTIIWHKPNCLPSSVKDRFTVDFEYLFFFSKSRDTGSRHSMSQ